MKTLATLLLAASFAGPASAGAWGAGSFENDDAMDWVAECVAGSGAQPVIAAFAKVQGASLVEAPDGSAAVAAAEVVAAALGKPRPGLPAELAGWLAKQPKPAIAAQASAARRALRKIEDPKASELRQLWSEGKSAQWLADVKDLETRLGGR